MIAVENYGSDFRLKSEWISLGKPDRWHSNVKTTYPFKVLKEAFTTERDEKEAFPYRFLGVKHAFLYFIIFSQFLTLLLLFLSFPTQVIQNTVYYRFCFSAKLGIFQTTYVSLISALLIDMPVFFQPFLSH